MTRPADETRHAPHDAQAAPQPPAGQGEQSTVAGAFAPAQDGATPGGARSTSASVASQMGKQQPSDAGTGFPGHQPLSSDRSSTRGASRSLFARAIYDTFGQTGARIAAVWILILVALAVFAPFIANSRPILIRTAGGELSSPMLASLDWLDVTLMVAFFAAVLLVIGTRLRIGGLSLSFGPALLAMVAIVGVAVPVSALLTNPPQNVVYEEWREREAAGNITWSLHTIVPYSANDRLNDSPGARQQPPGSAHWLGTTIYGEDMLSRMIHASRIALAIGFIATGISAVIGVMIGAVMGFFAGWIDLLLMRGIEIVEAIPRLILLLIVTAFFGKNIWLMMVTIGLISWTSDARFIRAEFLKLRKQDFVQAGIATGLPLRSILFRHMLPNGIAPVLVNVSFGVAGAILLESTLSFLGLGLEANVPSWGQLLNQARSGGTGFNWWIATFPGLAIFLTVFAYILIGEAMRDAIDPKMKRTEV